MGILCDPGFDSGKIISDKVNDIVATVSFVDDAMGKFLENCVLQEIYDLSAELSSQPEFGIAAVTKLPGNKVVHWMTKGLSYHEKLKVCKQVAPSLFRGHISALGKMGEIRNCVAHEWFRGAAMDQQEKEEIANCFRELGTDEEIKDIDDEYNDFQKVYNDHREFILTLERQSSAEFLGLNEKQS